MVDYRPTAVSSGLQCNLVDCSLMWWITVQYGDYSIIWGIAVYGELHTDCSAIWQMYGMHYGAD